MTEGKDTRSRAADMLLDGRIARGDRVTAVAADGGIILVRDGGS